MTLLLSCVLQPLLLPSSGAWIGIALFRSFGVFKYSYLTNREYFRMNHFLDVSVPLIDAVGDGYSLERD